jgi:flagellar basal-body rod protein FlgB
MFQTLDVIQAAQKLARNAVNRQGILAQNIAHADTPGYKARDVALFDIGAGGMQLQRNRDGHFGPAQGQSKPHVVAAQVADPNGNTVSLEDQMRRAAETRQAHDMATAVYGAMRGILRTALGR